MAFLAPLALTLGDPSGCGPALTLDAWSKLRKSNYKFFAIGPLEIYSSLGKVQLISDPGQVIETFDKALPVLPITMDGPLPIIGKPNPIHGKITIESIDLAVELARKKLASGVVTNPINKSSLYSIGFQYPGHTEYIAKLCKIKNSPVMMLIAGKLRVALATIHIPLMQVSDHLSIDGLTSIANIVYFDLKEKFGIKSPRLAFSGLNPHAGESGRIGDEEQLIINPAAKSLRGEGIAISDALPADTVFHEALNGRFDAVIAMTHDQGLIPIKLHDFWNGVNCTLGLEIIRTSPDHGTAYEATLQGNLRSDSIIAAIKCAYKLADKNV